MANESHSLSVLFQNRLFRVPDYQRGYAWKHEQLADFWEDLLNEALQVATSAIQGFLVDHDIDVTLVVFDKSAFTVSRELLGAVESYIDEHYVDTHQIRWRQLLDVEREALYEADEDVSYNFTIR